MKVQAATLLSDFAATRSTHSRIRASLSFRPVVAALFSLALIVTNASAGTETILHNFSNSPDGANAVATLVADSFGNLYGTTEFGGANGFGSVFVLCAPGALPPDILPCTTTTPPWAEYVLYSFLGPSIQQDGATPLAALVFGVGGQNQLYGTTVYGGDTTSALCLGAGGCGTVFQLCPPNTTGHGCNNSSNNNWKEDVLFRFKGTTGPDRGALPYGAVIREGKNTLYGTTEYGGNQGTCTFLIPSLGNARCGTIFKLKPTCVGITCNWAHSVVHDFKGAPTEGSIPYGTLCCTTNGPMVNLYGTTGFGGQPNNQGTVFRQPLPSGPLTVLYSFCSLPGCFDGITPGSEVIFDGAGPGLGNMYGTTMYGGSYGRGTIWKAAPPYLGNANPIYSFCSGGGGCLDGWRPISGLTLDNTSPIPLLYGTTNFGGANNRGVVYSFPSSGGVVSSYLKHLDFDPTGVGDGSEPYGTVIFDPVVPGSGFTTLYGVNPFDGASSVGTAFSLTLP